jgi:hypothetical protein
MHSLTANDCDHPTIPIPDHGHPRRFSLKVPAKPVIKSGAGEGAVASRCAHAPHEQGQGLKSKNGYD